MNIKLQLPSLMHVRPRITVVGVGGAGSNAVNNMIASGLSGVSFVVANTDSQSLANSSAETKIQLGQKLTEGLGAGARPEIGRDSAEEAAEEIRSVVARSHMVFIAAGMGGGTGTGAAAVIARLAREAGALTVGVVTKPFGFEGTKRMRAAEAGLAQLRPEVDTLIVIPNQNLFRVANERTTFAEAFVMADQVLYSGIACVVDLIVKEGLINLDFADVKTVMQGMGTAMMGTGEATGDRRAALAAEEAISNPLLDDVSLRGAKGLLVSITGNRSLTLYEVDEAATRVRQEVDGDANIIVGATFDDSLGDKVRVSIVASGMERQGSTQFAASPAASQAIEQQRPIDNTPPFMEPYTAAYTVETSAAEPQPVELMAQPAPQYQPPPQAQPAPSQETIAIQSAPAPAFSSAPLATISQRPEAPRLADPSLTRALSEALSYRDPASQSLQQPYNQAPHPGPQVAQPTVGWVSPSGAVFEETPVMTAPWMPTSGPGYAPMPAQGHSEHGARPAEPGQRRMPHIDEFPAVAQREYHAKAGQYSGQPGEPVPTAMPVPRAYTHPSNQPEAPRRRPGLLARLFGRHRQGKTKPAETASYQQAVPAPVATRAQPPHTPHTSSGYPEPAPRKAQDEAYDLPVFFGQSQR